MCVARSAWQCPLGAARTKADMPGMQSPQASRAARLESTLRQAFAPTVLVVTDDSARHLGHAGARPEGETHYSVLLVSPAFRSVGRVARSRAVHDALAAEFTDGLHALALTLRTPEEQESAP
jgi:stress-induced morphogen